MYGPTETTVWSTIYKVTREDLTHNAWEGKIPIGMPIRNTTIYILDPETLSPVANGCVGIVYIGGHGMALGYRHRPELTAERWLEDPFANEFWKPGGRMYCTGDLGYVDERNGCIICLGRADFQVKISGYRIELGEIESVVDNFCGVKEAVVLAVEGRDGDQKLVGYVISSAQWQGNFPFAKLKLFLSENMPMYMVPVYWVEMDAFPLLPNGKVNRNAFPLPDWDAAALAGSLSSVNVLAQPKNAIEEMIMGDAIELLGISHLGVEDNFFLLGANSLFAVRLHSRLMSVQSGLECTLSVSDIFEYPTVRTLANHMMDDDSRVEARHGVRVVVPLQPRGYLPPLFFIHPAGGLIFPYFQLASKLSPHQPFFAIQDPHLASKESIDPSTTICDMARFYIDRIKEIQPKGPYYIGGWSIGGSIAHEMGVQLLEKGEVVGLIIMVDTAFKESWRGGFGIGLQKEMLAGLRSGMVRTGLRRRANDLKEKRKEREGSQMRIAIGVKLLNSLAKMTPQGPKESQSPSLLLTGGRTDLEEYPELKKLAIAMYTPGTGVSVKDRWWRAHIYHNCFTGKGAVKWMISTGNASSVEEAVGMGQRLVDASVIRHVKDEHPFLNKFLFYRFIMDDQRGGSVSRQVRISELHRRLEGESEELELVEKHLRTHCDLRDRRYRLRKFKNCFVGSDAVECIMDGGYARTKSHAESLLVDLHHRGVFRHVTNDHGYKNAYLFYRFVDKAPLAIEGEDSSTTTTMEEEDEERRDGEQSSGVVEEEDGLHGGPISDGFEDVKSAQARRLIKLLNAHMSCASKHTPRYLRGRVALFSCGAGTGETTLSNNVKLWQSVCESLSVTEISGSHYTVVAEPHVSMLARGIISSLQESREHL